jgi:hypothetical protein
MNIFALLEVVAHCARSMAATRSMNDSSPSNHKLREAAVAYRTSADAGDLELPIGREFISLRPRLTPDQYVAGCEERLKGPLTQLVSPPDDPLLPQPEFCL